MPDFLYAIALLRACVWGGIAVMVAILIPVLAQALHSASHLPLFTQVFHGLCRATPKP